MLMACSDLALHENSQSDAALYFVSNFLEALVISSNMLFLNKNKYLELTLTTCYKRTYTFEFYT